MTWQGDIYRFRQSSFPHLPIENESTVVERLSLAMHCPSLIYFSTFLNYCSIIELSMFFFKIILVSLLETAFFVSLLHFVVARRENVILQFYDVNINFRNLPFRDGKWQTTQTHQTIYCHWPSYHYLLATLAWKLAITFAI